MQTVAFNLTLEGAIYSVWLNQNKLEGGKKSLNFQILPESGCHDSLQQLLAATIKNVTENIIV